ncbi:hypothetical protein BC936DRAFT_144829 [Jimgerdemannia flammicorona]|uniref:Leucine-rich repeat-containing N-terminal plant-type domain-containing protein n=1 Tax=Jimgerdemannia flammicorona TaxID=994334 RepID=A0A433DBI9_9FUNG|nr:hypothetical protein BC936DRAFT_144829 [Jimgerdemannia flammicorona]
MKFTHTSALWALIASALVVNNVNAQGISSGDTSTPTLVPIVSVTPTPAPIDSGTPTPAPIDSVTSVIPTSALPPSPTTTASVPDISNVPGLPPNATLNQVQQRALQSSCNTLQQLWTQMNGSSWLVYNGWDSTNANSTMSCCSWVKVTCNIVGVVTHLDLAGNNLQGNISSILSQLPGLIRLDMSQNNLAGTIPDNLAGLINLQVINFEYNNLSGPLPGSLGALPSLQKLYVIDSEELFAPRLL